MTNSSVNPLPQKYFFDAEFDYSETVDDIQSITPKKYYSDIEAAKAQSFEEGRQTGIQQTNNDIARVASDQLFVITAKIEDLITTEETILTQFHKEIAQTTELITRKVLPVLAEQGAVLEIKSMLDRIKGDLPKDQVITIQVHKSLQDAITAHIATLKDNSNFGAQVNVETLGTQTLTDCKITWQGAGIESFMQQTMKEIQSSLLRLAKTPLEYREDLNTDHQDTGNSDSDLDTDSENNKNNNEGSASIDDADHTQQEI